MERNLNCLYDNSRDLKRFAKQQRYREREKSIRRLKAKSEELKDNEPVIEYEEWAWQYEYNFVTNRYERTERYKAKRRAYPPYDDWYNEKLWQDHPEVAKYFHWRNSKAPKDFRQNLNRTERSKAKSRLRKVKKMHISHYDQFWQFAGCECDEAPWFNYENCCKPMEDALNEFNIECERLNEHCYKGADWLFW